MKIVVYMSPGVEHQQEWGRAFVRGLERHGIIATTAEKSEVRNMDADLAVFWGHKKRNVIDTQVARGKDYLVMERSYIGNRYATLSLGYNGLNGYADFVNKDMPSDRWDKAGVELSPWRETRGQHVLLVGQVEGDASHAGLVDIKKWYQRTSIQLQQLTDLPVVFRPHPLDLPPSRRDKLPPLHEQLAAAECVVTFNSNTGVDAILAGIPLITVNEGAMAWDMARHDIKDVNDLIKPDRQQWLNNLAYCQWNLDEIKAGEAWEHLKRRYE